MFFRFQQDMNLRENSRRQIKVHLDWQSRTGNWIIRQLHIGFTRGYKYSWQVLKGRVHKCLFIRVYMSLQLHRILNYFIFKSTVIRLLTLSIIEVPRDFMRFRWSFEWCHLVKKITKTIIIKKIYLQSILHESDDSVYNEAIIDKFYHFYFIRFTHVVDKSSNKY